MNYRNVGRFGVKVSEISLGGWLTQGRTLSDDITSALVHRAFELGINFFDTADAYNAGEAEKSLATAIVDLKREDLFIATKCFFPMSDAPNDRGLSRKHITESVHKSLKRLKTDYIDLMQFHRHDPTTPYDETARAIDDLIKQGKVLYWGVSEWTGQQISDMVQVTKDLNLNPPISNQPRYNILNRDIETEVLPVCEEHGVGNVVFSPLAQGVLTGKYKPNAPAPEGTRAADKTSNQFMGAYMEEDVLAKVQKLGDFAQEAGLTLPQLALGWCLRKPIISSVIIGATSIAQLEANVAATGIVKDDAFWLEAEAILQ